MKKILNLSLLLVGMLLATSCKDDDGYSKEELQPTKSVPVEPAMDAVDVELSTTLKWNLSTNLAKQKITYDLYVTENDKFTAGDLKESDIETGTFKLTELKSYCVYKWKVVAKHKELTIESDVFSFKTVAENPKKPATTSPANEATDIETSIKLVWTASASSERDPVTYDIFYGKTNEFTTAKKIKHKTTELDVADLDGNTTYFWKVVANAKSGKSIESDVMSFKTKVVAQPAAALTVPANGATDTKRSVKLTWTAKDANGTGLKYDVYVSETNEFTDNNRVATDIETTEHDVLSLKSSTQYFWKVVTKDGLENVVNSEVFSFTTKAPSPINITAPTNGFEGMPTELTWEAKDGMKYTVFISTSETITNYDIKGSRITEGRFEPTGLNADQKYYWQVKGEDAEKEEFLSPLYTFTTPAASIQVTEGTFTDIDGKVYKTVTINGVEWLAENYAKIPAESVNFKWGVPGFKSGEIAYADVATHANYTKYGLLYTIAAAKAIIPDGWHIATDAEWNELEKYIGMSQSDSELYSIRGNHAPLLKSDNTWGVVGTNETKMNILPAGYGVIDWGKYPNYKPKDFEISAVMLTGTKIGSKYVIRKIFGDQDGVKRAQDSSLNGYTIRLVKDK